MNSLDYELYYEFLTKHVLEPFYAKRLNTLNKLTLEGMLHRKNPYLFKAKNIELAGDLVKSVLDAFLSSAEETTFGNLLETFAIYVSSTVDGGFKSKRKSVDLEFQRNGVYYIVGIKSGPANPPIPASSLPPSSLSPRPSVLTPSRIVLKGGDFNPIAPAVPSGYPPNCSRFGGRVSSSPAPHRADIVKATYPSS